MTKTEGGAGAERAKYSAQGDPSAQWYEPLRRPGLWSHYSYAAGERQMGKSGVVGSFKNAQGLKLRSYFWPAANPKGVVVVSHGHGAYLLFEVLKATEGSQERVYEGSWVQGLNDAGFSVAGFDMQSHGWSEGARGLHVYCECFDDLCSDLRQFSEALAAFAVGCSVGGCITVLTAHQNPGLFRGLALLAPMLSLEGVAKTGLNPYLRPLTNIADYLIPTACLAATAENTIIPHLQAIYNADDLCWHKWTRVRSARHYLETTELVQSLMPNMTFPFITFHSARDTMVEPESSSRLYERTGPQVDKEFVKVDHMWHDLIPEDEDGKLLAHVIGWMQKRV